MQETELLHRVLGRDGPGVLVDVGAHVGSTLLPFAEAGWEVHAFEPDRVNREQLERNTAHLSNVAIVPMAVADNAGELTLYRSEESTGISSLTPFTRGHVPVEVVPVTTLRNYLAGTQPREVTLLKIDVEGYERFVLRGFPWDTYRPRSVILEFEDSKSVTLGYVWTDLAEDLRMHGYELFVSEWHPIDRYGITHHWRRSFSYPGQLRQERAWGNLIAVEDSDRNRLRWYLFLARIRNAIRRLAVTLQHVLGRRQS
jgi:FkbM family methyltransferase